MFTKRVFVVGGNGALGKAMVNSFKKNNWSICSLDFSDNTNAHKNIILDKQIEVFK